MPTFPTLPAIEYLTTCAAAAATGDGACDDESCPGWFVNDETQAIEQCDDCARAHGYGTLADEDVRDALLAVLAIDATIPLPARAHLESLACWRITVTQAHAFLPVLTVVAEIIAPTADIAAARWARERDLRGVDDLDDLVTAIAEDGGTVTCVEIDGLGGEVADAKHDHNPEV